MKIIIGHSHMDLDCIASVALARRLYPDYVPVMSGTIHPMARHLYNLYETELDFLPSKELSGADVEAMIVVDTRSASRLKEYFDRLGWSALPSGCRVVVYDHHPGEADLLPGATVHGGDYGATVTILGLELMRRGIELSPAEATIALAGMYSDTGNFTHDNVRADEFAVAAYLHAQGATVRLVTSFLKSLREEQQVDLFHQALGSVTRTNVRGHDVARFSLSLDKQSPGLAAVVERVFEVEGPDALFGIFHFTKDSSTLIVGRSAKARLKVNDILAGFGGGGHYKAASALIRNGHMDVEAAVLDAVAALAPDALTARDIMTEEVSVIRPGWSLLEASRCLEAIDHTGAPVVDDAGAVVGFLTLRDIMKGRKRGMMDKPVAGFMNPRVVSAPPEATLHDLEELFFRHNIGHLPVLAGGALLGIVTRSDYLRTVGGIPTQGLAQAR